MIEIMRTIRKCIDVIISVTLLLLFFLFSYCSTKKYYSMTSKFSFTTSYNQFYISDDLAPFPQNMWDEVSYNNRISVNNRFIGVITESYGNINGEIEILKSKKELSNFDAFDHVVEASIDIKSGKLKIEDCPNSSIELEISIKPGLYRIRIYSSNLKSVKFSDEYGDYNDFYKIELWEEDYSEVRVLKQW